MKQTINVVWFKRDLRLQDHQPLQSAIDEALPCILLYVFEPSLIQDEHYSEQHWRFITESLMDMNRDLKPYDLKINVAHSEVLDALSELNHKYRIKHVFSHEETGLRRTFDRDLKLKSWFAQEGIAWKEIPKDAVVRGLPNRASWNKHWQEVMFAPQVNTDLSKIQSINYSFDTDTLPRAWASRDPNRQKGGSSAANEVLQSFLDSRSVNYQQHISKPDESRLSCSRLSPYLAWGNLSLKQVVQTLNATRDRQPNKRSLSAFKNRLHWHCHFIQKFESEIEMQERCINTAYEQFEYRQSGFEHDLSAWKIGMTGYPLVDACMRCLHSTGYLNFRMRAMLVSFLTHHLNIDWKHGVAHLAKLFLDFEPGIHYPQFQMQASVTGINRVRIYNPTKQAMEHDSKATFIKQWCQELYQVPTPLIFEPWRLSPLEQQFYQVSIGDTYPSPIVDIKSTYKSSRDRLWSFRKRDDVRAESARILQRHVK